MLEETPDQEEIIEPVTALDIGKAEASEDAHL